MTQACAQGGHCLEAYVSCDGAAVSEGSTALSTSSIHDAWCTGTAAAVALACRHAATDPSTFAWTMRLTGEGSTLRTKHATCLMSNNRKGKQLQVRQLHELS